jgi:hypothetical protein
MLNSSNSSKRAKKDTVVGSQHLTGVVARIEDLGKRGAIRVHLKDSEPFTIRDTQAARDFKRQVGKGDPIRVEGERELMATRYAKIPRSGPDWQPAL